LVDPGNPELANRELEAAFVNNEDHEITVNRSRPRRNHSIDVVKEEETKEGMMNRWWVQCTRAISSIQRRIYSKTNLRAAMKQRKARLRAADTDKTLISADLYDAMMEVDSDTNLQFTPGGREFAGDVDSVVIPASEGEMEFYRCTSLF
jgi:hypothetical protein